MNYCEIQNYLAIVGGPLGLGSLLLGWLAVVGLLGGAVWGFPLHRLHLTIGGFVWCLAGLGSCVHAGYCLHGVLCNTLNGLVHNKVVLYSEVDSYFDLLIALYISWPDCW